MLRGRDIRRHRAPAGGWFLIDTHNGYGKVPAVNIDNYPAVKTHLDHHYPQLEKRQDKGRTPYNLRSCAYHEDFAKEKLFWMDMSGSGRFAYSDSEIYCNNAAYMITGSHLKFLCAVLNSTLISWFMSHTSRTTGMGLTIWHKAYVERLPIPKIDAAEQEPFVKLVDEILAAKAADANADTESLEWQIDSMVYRLYGLTEEEGTAVERSLGLIHQTDAAIGQAIDEALL